MKHFVKIRSIAKITPDVLQIVAEKPQGYIFVPGHATEISINKDGWKDEKRPFTFTSLPGDDHIEFTIKTYPSHQGVTSELLHLKKDDELILHDIFGDIAYKGEGLFIAGGAGVTPFISIFRDLKAKNAIGHNKLLCANKAKADIILEQEFKKLLGENFITILSDEKAEGYMHGYITEDLLRQHLPENNALIYLCGPPPMMDAVEKQLLDLGIHKAMIVKEGF